MNLHPPPPSPLPPFAPNWYGWAYMHRVLIPLPLPLGTAKAGRNNFEQVKYPLPPHWESRAYCNSSILIISLAAPLHCADVNSSYKRNAELTQWAFYINHYSELRSPPPPLPLGKVAAAPSVVEKEKNHTAKPSPPPSPIAPLLAIFCPVESILHKVRHYWACGI